MNNLLRIFYAILILTTISCGTQKIVTEQVPKVNEVNKFLDTYNANKFDYKTLQIKYNGKFSDGNQKISFGGSIKINKDSAIWINITSFGFEVARLFLTPDSVKFINRFQSLYYSGGYGYLAKKANMSVDFNTLQSIITNEIFPYPQNNNANFPLNYLLLKDSNSVYLQSHSDDIIKSALKPGSGQQKPIVEKLLFGVEEGTLQKVEIKDYPTMRFAEINYSDFKDINTSKFPYTIDVITKKQKAKIDVNLKFSKIETGKKLKMPFTIPSKYNPMK